MKKLITALSLVSLAACASNPGANQVQLDMAKATVLQKMGQPSITAGENGVESFTYYVYPTEMHKENGHAIPYQVKFKEGKVVKYGPLENKF